MATIQELTTKLNEALKLKAQIEALEAKLDAILGGTKLTTKSKKKVGKRTMSPATIEKMRAAQQARWATIKGKASPKKSTSAKAAPIKMVAKKKVGCHPKPKPRLQRR